MLFFFKTLLLIAVLWLFVAILGFKITTILILIFIVAPLMEMLDS